MSFLIHMLFFIYLFYNKKYLEAFDKKMMNIYFYGISSSLVFSILPQLLRVSNYYKVVFVIILANVLKNKKNKIEKVFIICILFFYGCYSINKGVNGVQKKEFIPYRNYLISYII